VILASFAHGYLYRSPWRPWFSRSLACLASSLLAAVVAAVAAPVEEGDWQSQYPPMPQTARHSQIVQASSQERTPSNKSSAGQKTDPVSLLRCCSDNTKLVAAYCREVVPPPQQTVVPWAPSRSKSSSPRFLQHAHSARSAKAPPPWTAVRSDPCSGNLHNQQRWDSMDHSSSVHILRSFCAVSIVARTVHFVLSAVVSDL